MQGVVPSAALWEQPSECEHHHGHRRKSWRVGRAGAEHVHKMTFLVSDWRRVLFSNCPWRTKKTEWRPWDRSKSHTKQQRKNWLQSGSLIRRVYSSDICICAKSVWGIKQESPPFDYLGLWFNKERLKANQSIYAWSRQNTPIIMSKDNLVSCAFE